MDSRSATLVPPRRLGQLLRSARFDADLSIENLAGSTGLTLVELDDIEHGRRLIDDEQLSLLLACYGIDESTLVPPRSHLVIDLNEGELALDDTLVADGAADTEAVLVRYLALVYRLRGLRPGSRIDLRDADIDVLSEALQLEGEDTRSRLQSLIGDESAIAMDQRRIRRRMLMPLVGVVVAAVSAGVLILVSDEPAGQNAPTLPTVEAQPSRATDIGGGGAVVDNRGPETDIGTPAVENN